MGIQRGIQRRIFFKDRGGVFDALTELSRFKTKSLGGFRREVVPRACESNKAEPTAFVDKGLIDVRNTIFKKEFRR